jgi:hypothetical protein
MPNPADISGSVFKNGTAALMARIIGADMDPIEQADVADIVYSIYQMTDSAPDERDPVEGHTAVTLSAANVIYDSLQTGDQWTIDATGYNFMHVPPIDAHPAFPVAGKRFLVEYTITPTSGQPIIVRFRLSCI